MGALPFVLPQLVEALGARHPVDSAARPPSAVPATGWRVLHERQRQALLDRAFSA
jgi:hypothetical protein